ncbi:DUF397 domain-containing protein [Streptomyces sp. NPDC086077]|uniref:DUF397 domain-containing protein n=1 Tax=Streptomyces sp. NPDC086077 TaxID=3154862 RepID=UPI00342F2E47
MGTNLNLTGAAWRKSSYSGDTGGQCVEVADLAAHIAIRDSKSPSHGSLTLTVNAFTAFVTAAAQGELASRPA